jgi:hypothetical protein
LDFTLQGSLLGLALALVISLFFGIGAILAGNAGKLPSQKLPLRTDGCYCWNESGAISSDLSSVERLSLRENTSWKDEEYSGFDNLFAISFQWQPMIPVVGTILFGLIFSVVVNVVRKVRNRPVKEKYLTPVILSMWVKVFGKVEVSRWVEFEVLDSDQQNEMEGIRNSMSR